MDVIKATVYCGLCKKAVFDGVVKLELGDIEAGFEASLISIDREKKEVAHEEGKELVVEFTVGCVDWTLKLTKCTLESVHLVVNWLKLMLGMDGWKVRPLCLHLELGTVLDLIKSVSDGLLHGIKLGMEGKGWVVNECSKYGPSIGGYHALDNSHDLGLVVDLSLHAFL